MTVAWCRPEGLSGNKPWTVVGKMSESCEKLHFNAALAVGNILVVGGKPEKHA